MSQDTILIIVAGILLGAGILFRRWYLSLAKTYKVSEQYSAGRKLTVTEIDARHENAQIELNIQATQAIAESPQVFVEFISKKKEIQKFGTTELEINSISGEFLNDNKECTIRFLKKELYLAIRRHEIDLFRFRFVVDFGNNQLIKSHIFAISSRNMLYRPEIGKSAI